MRIPRLGPLLDAIKFKFTIFALPFAFTGAMLGAGGIPGLRAIFWVTVAMAGARSAAMGFNLLVDRPFDSRNPRTAHWPTVTGEVSRRANLVLIIVSLAVLFGAASRLNPLALKLFPAAVVIVLAYSYTKRFTWACHLFLGLAQSLAPMGGWVAVTGTLETPAVLLGIAAGSWVAGFDIIYACQDVEFDRREGLHSIPARFGVAAGLRLARTLHLVTVAALVLAAPAAGLGWIYLLGVAVAAGLLVFEHSLVSPRDLSMAPVAFFKVNAVVSVTIMIAVMASLLIGID